MDPRANPIRRQLCAIYTRKSSEEGLEQEFNSLHAQREACEAYIASERSEGGMGGYVPLGYDVKDRKLVVNEDEAAAVRGIFERLVEVGSATVLARELRRKGLRNKLGTLVARDISTGC